MEGLLWDDISGRTDVGRDLTGSKSRDRDDRLCPPVPQSG